MSLCMGWRLLFLACSMTLSAAAQVVRLGGGGVRPMGIVVGGATITATPGNISFTLNAGNAATASSPITVSTAIAGAGLLDTIQIIAYFPASTALSTAAGDTIPASAIYAACSTCASTARNSFTQTTSLGGSYSFVLENGTDVLTISGGTRTYALNVTIDLGTLPQAPAGTYTGTLVIAAQMF